MQVQNYFRTATILFYEGKYEEAIRSINRYLEFKPSNSLAFNNRALMYFHMGQNSQAREDIITSIQLNHLNYVSYFNLFSVESRENDDFAALLALRGALSCLYLIKGRLLKDKALLTKALHFSSNNLDALLILVLLQIRDQNYDQALILIEAFQSLNEKQRILQKMRALILQLQEQYSDQMEEALYDFILEASPVQHKLSGNGLKPNNKLSSELKEAIEQGVKQFNQLYSQLNTKAGGVSFLIAKSPEGSQCRQEELIKQEKNQMFKKKQILAEN